MRLGLLNLVLLLLLDFADLRDHLLVYVCILPWPLVLLVRKHLLDCLLSDFLRLVYLSLVLMLVLLRLRLRMLLLQSLSLMLRMLLLQSLSLQLLKLVSND